MMMMVTVVMVKMMVVINSISDTILNLKRCHPSCYAKVTVAKQLMLN